MIRFASQTVHAHQRAHERFGLSFGALKRIGEKIIRESDATIKTRGNRTNHPLHDRRPASARFVRGEGDREIWIATEGAREIPVVWDAATKTIVTVLPKHALKELHRQL